MDLKQGQRVRFTAEKLGVVRKDGAGVKFLDDVFVNAGDEGMVVVPAGSMPDGWIAIEPDGRSDCYVPVAPSMVEAL